MENIQDILFIEQFLKEVDNPYMLAFLAIWVIHYMIKQSKLDNRWIMPVLSVIGGVLGYILFDSNHGIAGNAIMGIIVAAIQFGVFGAIGRLASKMRK